MKQTGHIGYGANDKKELKILNRTIKIERYLLRVLLESMQLNGAKSVDSPRVRRTEEQTAQIENSEKLTSAESTLYRSLVMKLAYVAQDRVDIAEAVMCLKRHMKEPRSGHMQELKRLGRYLVKNRRCVLTYARQTSDATLQVHVDSDWAGDLLGRKSTTGVIVRRGTHLLRHMSRLQSLVAISSGEAEYYALIRGACTSLGVQSHYQDWMNDVPIQICSDRYSKMLLGNDLDNFHNFFHQLLVLWISQIAHRPSNTSTIAFCSIMQYPASIDQSSIRSEFSRFA